MQLGYDIDCMDLMDDEIKVFRRNAKSLGVSPSIKKLSWKQIPEHYKNRTYDFLFCRGNSFIYADGGWNCEQEVDRESSLKSHEETLKIFYDLLVKGGHLYIDKFPDNEEPHKDVVARLRIEDQLEDLVYYNKRSPAKRYREAGMLRRKSNGDESGLPNMTYDLSEKELEDLLKKVGFRTIKKLNLQSEKNFNIWLAQK